MFIRYESVKFDKKEQIQDEEYHDHGNISEFNQISETNSANSFVLIMQLLLQILQETLSGFLQIFHL